jgi:class 3 adenylate cyclase
MYSELCVDSRGSKIPLGDRPKECLAVILFADLMSSAVLADSLDDNEYQITIREFHEIARKVHGLVFGTDSDPKEEYSPRTRPVGDEVMLLVPCRQAQCVRENENLVPSDPDSMDVHDAIYAALRFARHLKLEWLMSDRNVARIRSNKRPLDLGIGINVGPIQFRQERPEGRPTPEGHAIVLAKRVETESRRGHHTNIMLSRNAYQKAIEAEARVSFTEIQELDLKGFSHKEYAVEMKSFLGYIYWDPVDALWSNLQKSIELFNHDCFNIWLGIEIAVAQYYRMEFWPAIRTLEKVLTADPGFAYALMLQGECYFNLSLRTQRDLESQALFFHNADELMGRAIELDPSEDAYLQRGLMLMSWAERQRHPPDGAQFHGTIPNSESLRGKAKEYLDRAMALGRSRHRAAYWKWVITTLEERIGPHDAGAPRKDAGKMILASVAHQAGWIDQPKPDISEEEIRDLANKHVEKYGRMVFLDPYLANMCFACSLIYSDAFSCPDVPAFERLARMAITRAKDIRERWNDHVAVWASTSVMSSLQTCAEFIRGVENAIACVQGGKRVIDSWV